MSTTPVSLSSVFSTANSATAAANSTSSALSSAAPSESEFLQLLVAQLQYQDPSQPADGTQFVTELAQFADVGNTTSMSSDLGSMLGLMEGTATASGATSANAATPSGSTGTGTTPATNS